MIEHHFDFREVKDLAGRLGKVPKRIETFVRRALVRGMRKIIATVKRERMSGPPGIKAGKKLKGSLGTEVSKPGTPLARMFGRAIAKGKILRLHETGGLVRARAGKYLAIKVKRPRHVLIFRGRRAGESVRVKRGTIILTETVYIRPRLQFVRTARRVVFSEVLPNMRKEFFRAFEILRQRANVRRAA